MSLIQLMKTPLSGCMVICMLVVFTSCLVSHYLSKKQTHRYMKNSSFQLIYCTLESKETDLNFIGGLREENFMNLFALQKQLTAGWILAGDYLSKG